MTTIVLIFPAITRTAGDHELSPLTFANRSLFTTAVRLAKSGTITPEAVINVSLFGHVRVTTGDDIDLLPTAFVNTSTFGDDGELAESGPDVNLRPTAFVNVSAFPDDAELAESSADVNLRPTAFANVSTFADDTVLSPGDEGGGGDDDENTDGADGMVAGGMVGGQTV